MTAARLLVETLAALGVALVFGSIVAACTVGVC